MSELERTLEEHWPPNAVIVNCKECGGELLNTNKKKPAIHSASYLSTVITTLARKHQQNTQHDGIDVAIDKEPTPVREIDCDITVRG